MSRDAAKPPRHRAGGGRVRPRARRAPAAACAALVPPARLLAVLVGKRRGSQPARLRRRGGRRCAGHAFRFDLAGAAGTARRGGVALAARAHDRLARSAVGRLGGGDGRSVRAARGGDRADAVSGRRAGVGRRRGAARHRRPHDEHRHHRRDPDLLRARAGRHRAGFPGITGAALRRRRRLPCQEARRDRRAAGSAARGAPEGAAAPRSAEAPPRPAPAAAAAAAGVAGGRGSGELLDQTGRQGPGRR